MLTEFDVMMALLGGYGPEDRERLLEVSRHVIAAGRPDEVIERHGMPYMERWHLVRASSGALGNLYVHRFVRDDDEDLHCHPWASTSFVLRGAYVERTDDGKKGWSEGDVVSRTAEERHAIDAVQPGTITLLATGPKTRDWGFYPVIGGQECFMSRDEYRAFRDRQNAKDKAA